MKKILGSKTKFILSLSIASVIWGQAAWAEFEIHCPAQLIEHSTLNAVGNTVYTYSGETTGGKKLPVVSILNNLSIKLTDPPKFVDIHGAASSFVCVYEGTQSGQVFKSDVGGHFTGINQCKRVKPESGEITVENTYYKCEE